VSDNSRESLAAIMARLKGKEIPERKEGIEGYT
jgi:hypothetical protein